MTDAILYKLPIFPGEMMPMKRQKSLANAKSFVKNRVKQTRREKSLAEMDKIVP